MMKFAIVAVGYNRPDSMLRLLKSLQAADYLGDKVDLIISIDKGMRQEEIVNISNSILWIHGDKRIRAYSERQGLRHHILQCGDLTNDYDVVVVLEDDIVVAEGFYSYVKQVIYYYGDDQRIAGISLYKHCTNPLNGRPFEPMNNGYDVYFMQFAQSWGQCWMKCMWQEFKDWYRSHDGSVTVDETIPAYVASWNDRSWLKYYCRYIIETDKFFVYPHISLSTNCSEVGEHCNLENNDYQVPLLNGVISNYRFASFEKTVKYDAYFERMIDDYIAVGISGKIILDLMGGRTIYGDSDYLISTNNLPYEIVRTMRMDRRPIEHNVLYPKKGEGIFVYNLHKRTQKIKGNTRYSVARYDVKAIHWKMTLRHGLYGFKTAIMERLKRK